MFLDAALHCRGAGDLFLLGLVHLGPVGLPYLPGGLQPDHQRGREGTSSALKCGRITRRFSVLPVTDQRLVVGEERGGRGQPLQPAKRRPQLLHHPLWTHAPQVGPQPAGMSG